MKDSKGYLERMKGAMREKLFFIEHLDLNNKIIIDFGAADGTLVKELISIGYENTTYFCVEDYEEFLQACKQLKEVGDVTAVSGLTEIEVWLREHKQYGSDTREVVLICSSVLHECTWSMQRVVNSFATNWCHYFIVRDMYYDNLPNNKLTLFGELRALEQFIMLSPRPNLLQDYFVEADKNSKSLDEKIKEYLLKYTYVDNWETEVQEDYFHVDWNYIFSHEHIIYQRIYTNQFIKQRVYEDFNITITWPTHCQVIIQIAKER